MKKIVLFATVLYGSCSLFAQNTFQDSTKVYKKKVLESTEIDILASYYSQDGDNAAVTGGIGTEQLTDIHPTVVIAIPLNEDDVLTVDAGISAYSSASSSNVDPFDGSGEANPFQASSGASSGDTWIGLSANYSHSSDDRNRIWSANTAFATEYDYTSFGAGGSYTMLFNEKNTELSFKANVFLDTWKDIYPIELRSSIKKLDNLNRNSFSLGLGFSQILTRNMQASLSVDLVQQNGLLSTPFQRVYFSDFEDSFREGFHLADDIERLPDTRFKIAVGGRLHYFINEQFVSRLFYRYYTDDWGIQSHTASVEIPIKVSDHFTLSPSYRFYNQTQVDYFAPYNQHLSTNEFYTSDYDLSEYSANQYGLSVTYTDIFTQKHIGNWGLKNVHLKLNYYERDSRLNAFLIAVGVKFVRN
jgi:hypothetical protein